MAASKNEGLAVEDTAVGIVVQIEGDHIGATFIMNIVQSGIADGDELRLVVGSAL